MSPGPASRFGTDAEGWTTGAGDDATGTAPPPVWQAPADAGGSGTIRVDAPPATPWWFRAPAPFLGDQRLLVGGTITLVLAYGPDPQAAGAPPAVPRRVRLVGGDRWVERDTTADAGPGPDPDSWRVTTTIDVGGWTTGPSATPATLADLRAVTADLAALLVEGAPQGVRGWTELGPVTTTLDPAEAYRLDLDAWVEDGAIWVAFSPFASAGGYAIEVRDAGGVVATVDLDPEGLALPTRAWAIPQPAGGPYTVAGWVTGERSPDVVVTPADLAAPAPRAEVTAVGTDVVWPAVAGATAYELAVTPLPTGWTGPRRVDGTTFGCTTDAGFALDTPYQVTVRARTASARGPWSPALPLTVSSARRILTALRDRLVGGRTPSAPSEPTSTPAYHLDAAALPPDRPEQADTALAALTRAYPDLPAIVAAADPALDPDGATLTLTGTAATMGLDGLPVTLTATVDDAHHLQLALAVALPDGWRPGDSFPALAPTAVDGIDPTAVALTATSSDGGTTTLQLTIAVPTDLGPPPTDDTEATVVLRGPVTLTGSDPARSITGTLVSGATVARIGARPVGRPAVTLTDARVTLAATETGGDLYAESTDPAGPTRLALPTTTRQRAALTHPGGSLDLTDLATALSAVGLPDVATRLPAPTGVATPALRSWVTSFDPRGAAPTVVTVAIGSDASWALASTPRLAVTGWTLTVEWSSDPVAPVTITVTGDLAIGGTPFAVSLTIDTDGLATLVIDAPEPPTLAALAGLVGFTSVAVTDAMPPGLRTLGEIGLLGAGLVLDLGDVATSGPRLVSVFLQIGQTQEWTVVTGALRVSGWVLDLSLRQVDGEWDAAGWLAGDVHLGSGSLTFHAELPVPARAGEPWTIGLAEGATVAVPTIGELLTAAGVDATALPTGLTTLGGLVLDELAVAFDPTVPELIGLRLHAAQSSPWVIAGATSVTDLDLSLRLAPGATPPIVAVLSGTIVLAGHPVDLAMMNDEDDPTWVAEAAYSYAVHVPGFADLDAWLHPGEAATAVPAGMPLAHGFDLSDVAVRFGGPGGAIDQISFRAGATDVWSVIDGKIAIEEIAAELTVPVPMSSAGVVGTVRGVVAVGPTVAVLTADKPAPGDPWTFTGSLLAPVAVDLLAVAAQATDAAIALPADIATWDFPTQVHIDEATVRAVPDTGAWRVRGTVGFDWTPAVGGTHLRLTQLAGVVERASTTAPVTVGLAGRLELLGLQAAAGIGFGGGDTHTVVTGALTADEAAAIDVRALAGGLGTTTTDTWGSLTPATLARPSFSGAAMWADLTDRTVVVHGEITGFARGVVYAHGTADDTWGWAVAVDLGTGFRFADLVPELGVIDDVLTVAEARLVVAALPAGTIGDLGTAVGRALALAAPGATNPLASLAAPEAALQRGAAFVARLDLQPTSVFGRILQIGPVAPAPAPTTDGTPPAPTDPAPTDPLAHIAVVGLIDQVDPTRTRFEADLPDLTIAGTVRLTRTGTNAGIHLVYTPGDAQRFTLDGRVELLLFGSTYGFDLHVVVDDVHLETTGQLVPTTQSVRPFGLPGIEITQLAARLAKTFAAGETPARTRFDLVGSVLIGPPPAAGAEDHRIALSATLVVLETTPVLVRLRVDRDLSVADFIGQCISGDGAHWGDNVDLVMHQGSVAYYYDAAADPGQLLAADGTPVPADGYHVDATVTLRLVADLTVRAQIDVTTTRAEDTGQVEATAVTGHIGLVDPLRLFVVELAGPTAPTGGGPYTGGPALTFKTFGDGTPPAFGAATGINFMGEPFASVQVSVARITGGRRFHGELRAPGPVGPFGTLACSFTYDALDTGPSSFHIDDWPEFAWAAELVDIVTTVQRMFDAASGFGCGSLVSLVAQQAFTTSWTFTPKVRAEGEDAVFALTGTYGCSLPGASTPFVVVTFPEVVVRVPMATRYSDLPEALARAIGNAGADFVQALLDDPKAIAAFAAIVGGREAAEWVANLICQGLVDAAAEALTAAAADALADALLAGAGAGAAAAAASIAAGLVGGHSGHQPAPHPKPDGPPPPPPPPDAPARVDLSVVGDALVATWPAAGRVAAYDVEHLVEVDGVTTATALPGIPMAGPRTGRVPLAGLAAGAHRVQVRGTRSGMQSAWVASAPLVKPPTPAAPVLRFDTGDLVVDLPAGQAYDVRFGAPDGTEVATVPAATGEARAAVPDPVPGGYTATIRQAGGGIAGEWSPATALVVDSMAPTTGLMVRTVAAGIEVSWEADPSSPQHDVRIRGAATADAVTRDTAVVLGAAEGIPRPLAVGTYTIRARGRTAGAASPWSDPVDLVVGAEPAWTIRLINDTAASALVGGVPLAAGAETVASIGPAGLAIEAEHLVVEQTVVTQRLAVTPRSTGVGHTYGITALAALAGGTDPDLAVTRVLGVRFTPAPWKAIGQVWADTTGLDAIALLLVDAKASPAALAGALGALAPDAAAVAAALLPASGDPKVVVDVLSRLAPTRAALVTALDAGFAAAGQPLDPTSVPTTLAGGWLPFLAVPDRDLLRAVLACGSGAWSLDDRLRMTALVMVTLSPPGMAEAFLNSIGPGGPQAVDPAWAAAVGRAVRDAYAPSQVGTSSGPPDPVVRAHAARLAAALPPATVARRLVRLAALPRAALAGADPVAALQSAYTGTAVAPSALADGLAVLGATPDVVAQVLRQVQPAITATEIAKALALRLDPRRATAIAAFDPNATATVVARASRGAAGLVELGPGGAVGVLAEAVPLGIIGPAVLAAALETAGVDAATAEPAVVALFAPTSPSAIAAAVPAGQRLRDLYA